MTGAAISLPPAGKKPMARDLKVGLELTIKDSASATVSKALQTLAREGKEAGTAINGLARSGKELNAIAQAPQTASRGLQELARQSKVAEQAVGGLGYKVRELGRTPAATSTIAGLRQIVQQANLAERSIRMLGSGIKGLQAYGTGVGAVMAGSYVLAQPAKRTMDYDRRLAMMANTAYADRDMTGRKVGMRELDAAVQHAVRTGGGTREEAADTLNNLISSGSMSQKSAINLLPVLQKYATGTGADPKQLGDIAIRAMQSFKIKEQDVPMALDMAIMAGQEGGFELDSMARWLPQQMAAAKQSGLSGMAGMAKLLAINQAAAITAGTKDGAGNNVVNLLAKINSSDTANDASKISATTFREKKKGEKGIDLAGTLALGRAKGMDSIEVFIGLVDKVVAGDQRYQKIQAQLKTATNEDRKALLESQGDILQGSAIGKLIQDRETLMALIGVMSNREYVKNIENKLPNAGGTGQANFDLIESTASHQTERLKNEKAIAEQNAFGDLSGVVGDVAGKLADYAKEYPGATVALVGATTALNALSAAAMAGGLLSLLRGGGGVGAASGPVAKVAGAAKDAAKSLFPLGSGAVAAAAAIGALPLAVMGLVAKKAGETEKDNDRAQSLLGFTDTLKDLLDQLGFNKDADIEERRRKNRADLNDDPGQLPSGQINEVLPDRIAAKLEQAYRANPIPVHVTVDVQNGNIVAAVNAENSRNARRN
ncbi:phage tail tape measure protein [Laribacter hongkongensis]|uniref:phage tail tape measure protein n=1 Tax=Laribacter hongkongensis TaxID=168471 RepID=UPI001EFDA989|nr:phage tail tape measure protein [Laribacter hongkongensis]MCG9031622.1 phage tail tape measure protein [Laribacter hongkongensis]MCG9093127.1 phage tail tape measure protein [Laribacter hongkongensis]